MTATDFPLIRLPFKFYFPFFDYGHDYPVDHFDRKFIDLKQLVDFYKYLLESIHTMKDDLTLLLS